LKVYHKDGKKSIKGEVAGRDSLFNRRGRKERRGFFDGANVKLVLSLPLGWLI
jgi:hypothetical protein